MKKAICAVCPRACALAEGEAGFCRARVNRNAQVEPLAYGAFSALSLDPIEKKPLYHFYPGSKILSVGGYGCNMRCGFCQNHQISQRGPERAERITPEALVMEAGALVSRGNIGLAFTYNEPGVNLEFVLDASRLLHEAGLYSVMVTNGYLSETAVRALLPSIEAWNIDLKCFSREGYASLCGGLHEVKRTIALVANAAHLEVTTLIVPGLSDSEADMVKETDFLADISPDIPLHISRYFPAYQSTLPPTGLDVMRRLLNIARRRLKHVYFGNV